MKIDDNVPSLRVTKKVFLLTINYSAVEDKWLICIKDYDMIPVLGLPIQEREVAKQIEFLNYSKLRIFFHNKLCLQILKKKTNKNHKKW